MRGDAWRVLVHKIELRELVAPSVHGGFARFSYLKFTQGLRNRVT